MNYTNELCYTYCKFSGEKKFIAYDINDGVPAGRLIYCTLIELNEKNCEKLQKLADLNKDNGLVIQLRSRNKVLFETKS